MSNYNELFEYSIAPKPPSSYKLSDIHNFQSNMKRGKTQCQIKKKDDINTVIICFGWDSKQKSFNLLGALNHEYLHGLLYLMGEEEAYYKLDSLWYEYEHIQGNLS